MAAPKSMPEPHEEAYGGFGRLDEKGRISVPKAVREELGLHAGSPLAYVVLNGIIMFIPQDEHLAALSEHAAQTLARLGLTVQDLLDELPAARAEVVAEHYGAEYMAELERERKELQAKAGAE